MIFQNYKEHKCSQNSVKCSMFRHMHTLCLFHVFDKVDTEHHIPLHITHSMPLPQPARIYVCIAYQNPFQNCIHIEYIDIILVIVCLNSIIIIIIVFRPLLWRAVKETVLSHKSLHFHLVKQRSIVHRHQHPPPQTPNTIHSNGIKLEIQKFECKHQHLYSYSDWINMKVFLIENKTVLVCAWVSNFTPMDDSNGDGVCRIDNSYYDIDVDDVLVRMVYSLPSPRQSSALEHRTVNSALKLV